MAVSIFGTKANNTDIVVKDTGTGNVDLGSGTLTTTGTVTGNTFSGSGASLTALPSAQLTGALPAVDGSALTSLTSANLTGALPAIDGSALTGLTAGGVLQVQTDELTAVTNGSGGFSNTGLEVTITPTSASSKILLLASGVLGTDRNTVSARYTENGTAVALADPNGSRTRASFRIRGASDNNHAMGWTHHCILAPNSTSALTYRIQFFAESSGTWYLNRNWNFSNSSNSEHSVTTSYLTAIELLGSITTINTQREKWIIVNNLN